MLRYEKNGQSLVLNYPEYWIQEEWFGAEDSLQFSLPSNHPQRKDMCNRLQLTDKQSGQVFLIEQLDDGDIKACLDLEDWKEQMYLQWSNEGQSVGDTIRKLLPTGWSMVDLSADSLPHTIVAEGATALEIVKEVADAYGVGIRFVCKTKQIVVKSPDAIAPSGVYLSQELNLKQAPICSSSSKDFATRLYAVGKDGLTFASINEGKPYIDNNLYSDRIISAYWKNEQLETPEGLLAEAVKQLNQLAMPAQSYQCDLMDLAKIDPQRWGHLQVEMYQSMVLMDCQQNQRVVQRVVQYRRYPEYPEKNVITLSTLPGTLSSKVEQSYHAITNPNSRFQQQLGYRLKTASDSITGRSGGSKRELFDAQGMPCATLYMDNTEQQQAQNVLKLDSQGLGFSTNGVNGSWKQAIFSNGQLNSNWTDQWQLDAKVLKKGQLQSQQQTTWWNLETGNSQMKGSFCSEQQQQQLTIDQAKLTLTQQQQPQLELSCQGIALHQQPTLWWQQDKVHLQADSIEGNRLEIAQQLVLHHNTNLTLQTQQGEPMQIQGNWQIATMQDSQGRLVQVLCSPVEQQEVKE